jgi:hypothetical protein
MTASMLMTRNSSRVIQSAKSNRNERLCTFQLLCAETTTIGDTDLVKEAIDKLELDETVPGGPNLARLQVGTEPPGMITSSIEMVSPMDPDEHIAFIQFRQYLTMLQRATDESKTMHHETAADGGGLKS